MESALMSTILRRMASSIHATELAVFSQTRGLPNSTWILLLHEAGVELPEGATKRAELYFTQILNSFMLRQGAGAILITGTQNADGTHQFFAFKFLNVSSTATCYAFCFILREKSREAVVAKLNDLIFL